MIAMVESGRLGNQIFQYLALKSAAKPNESLLLFGFDHLRTTFDGVEASFIHISSNPMKHLVSLNYSKLKRFTESLPGVGSIIEDSEARPQRDARSRVAIANPSWFQSDLVLGGSYLQLMRVRSEHLRVAQSFLDSNLLLGESTIVVHVRAGDYRSWPSKLNPAILSPRWYQEKVAELQHRIPNLVVVAIGDEFDYTNEVIAEMDNAFVYSGGYANEFALMTLCRFGVLSASSFAYWGAYFAKRKYPQGVYLAPKYWAGHTIGSWYPKHIQADFIDYR